MVGCGECAVHRRERRLRAGVPAGLEDESGGDVENGYALVAQGGSEDEHVVVDLGASAVPALGGGALNATPRLQPRSGVDADGQPDLTKVANSR